MCERHEKILPVKCSYGDKKDIKKVLNITTSWGNAKVDHNDYYKLLFRKIKIKNSSDIKCYIGLGESRSGAHCWC